MNHFYIEVSEAFAIEHNGTQTGANVFNAVQALNGKWYCSINSLQEFTELFPESEYTVVSLTEADFYTEEVL